MTLAFDAGNTTVRRTQVIEQGSSSGGGAALFTIALVPWLLDSPGIMNP